MERNNNTTELRKGKHLTYEEINKMTGSEFVANYIMHDSLIDSVDVQEDGTRVVIIIDFAFWMQNGYRESDPETGAIRVTFNDVSNYDVPEDADWNEISILETSLENGRIKFALMNDMTDDYLEIIIESSSVDVEPEI